MTVIYLDTLFLLNLWLDGLLLTASRRLAGLAPRWRRTIPAAALGGLYASAVFCLPWEWLTAFPARLMAAFGMVWLAVGREKESRRVFFLFFLLSCTLAGSVLMMNAAGMGSMATGSGFPVTGGDGRLLMLCGGGEYLLVSLLSRYQVGKKSKTVTVLLCCEGKKVLLRALRDSGNLLRDPVTGERVMIAEYDGIRPLLSAHPQLNQEAILHPAHHTAILGSEWGAAHLRLLPYSALGTEHGLLLGVRLDRMEVEGEVIPRPMVAVTTQKLSKDGHYQGIIHL